MKSTAHTRRFWAMRLLGLAAASLLLTGQALSQTQSIDGLWDATVTVHNMPIPFRLELSSSGTGVTSYFFNGDDKVNPSTQGSFRDGLLDLKFASYATELKATFSDGSLTGSFEGGPKTTFGPLPWAQFPCNACESWPGCCPFPAPFDAHFE